MRHRNQNLPLPTSSRQPPGSNPRWSWAAGAACAVVPGASLHAATVQITQTGNLISTDAGTAGLDGDFTGQMNPEAVLTGMVVVSSTSTEQFTNSALFYYFHSVTLQIDSNPLGRARGSEVIKYLSPGTSNFGFFYLLSNGTQIRVNAGSGYPYDWDYLYPVTFSDVRINNGQPTSGFLDVSAFNISHTKHAVQIRRLIFDNESTEAPSGVDIMNTYSEWTPAPEIDVVGNGISIVSGDTTPSETDHTDFGESPQGISVVRTFEIKNNGPLDLTVTSTSVTAGDFSSGNVSGTVTPGNSLNLQVTFTPTALGERTATITINNDDSDEGTYTFSISGVGLEAPVDPPDPTVVTLITVTNFDAVFATVFKNKIKKLKQKLKKAKSSGNSGKAKKFKEKIKKLKKKLKAL